MEPSSKFSERIWSSNAGNANSVHQDYPISGSFVDDDAEMVTQLLTSYTISNEQTLSPWSYEPQTVNMVDGEESMDSGVYFCSDLVNPSMDGWPCLPPAPAPAARTYEMYSNSSKDFANSCYMENDQSQAIQYLQNQWGDASYGNDDPREMDATRNFDAFHLSSDRNALPKRKPQLDDSVIGLPASSSDNPKKKSRASINVQRGGKNTHAKKATQKTAMDEGDDSAALNLQTTSSSNSEDESIVSQGQNGTLSSNRNVNVKTRAGRGSATDPQSLYARKRRERINERLKILQSLVPNGTKVDISTMLEEAVDYVKFLQLQIKLLSSDDLWMYAPIAYNGMNIGLDLKIAPP